MDEYYDLLDDMDLRLESIPVFCPDLTEEELEAIESQADRWLMGLWGL